MRPWLLIAIAASALGATTGTAQFQRTNDTRAAPAAASIERGRYLVRIGGCNDCHTPDYLASAGKVPESRWLVGSALGFNGPWGTTYPSNLRSLMHTMAEDDWVDYARTLEARPPMPWFNLRIMTEDDLRAMHRYVRSLPADETPVPDYVPPGREPTTPYIVMAPRMPRS
jgi:mono/diheme cytochrome c family protein